MLTATGTTQEGRRLFVFGLTEENIRQLQRGQNLRVTRETHPGFRHHAVINIRYGETAEDIVNQLRTEGEFGPDTEVIDLTADPTKHPEDKGE